jgi:hypothetical protein
MKCVLPLLSAALCAVSSVFAGPTLGGPEWAPEYMGEKDALMTPTAVIPAEGAARVWAEWTQGDTTVRVDFTEDGGMWSANLPANHAGQVYCTIFAEDANGVPADQPQSLDYVLTENMDDSRGLTNQRYPAMNRWTIGSSGLGNLDNDWYGALVSRDSAVPQMIRLKGDLNPAKAPDFEGQTAGFVRTREKVTAGVGSFWFKAKMVEQSAPNGKLIIDKITTRTVAGFTRYTTKTIAEITVPKANGVYEWHQFHLLVQDSPANANSQAYYRIRNNTEAASSSDADLNAVAIDICDIVLTPVIPDVKIYKDELDYAPGFPSILDPIQFHIAVSNVFPSAPAAHITPRLHWRQGTRASWNVTEMTNTVHYTEQGDGTYACILTPEENGLSDGPFEYFYTVDFTGYTPTFPARKNKGEGVNNIVNYRFNWNQVPYLIHTNAWGLLMDANENISECRSPAVCPTFWDTFEKTGVGAFHNYAMSYDVVPETAATNGLWDVTRKFDLFNLDEGWPSATLYYPYRDADKVAQMATSTFQIQGTYFYNTFLAKDGVRRFRSLFTDLAAVTEDFSTNTPSFLDRAYPMQHVGDYTWQAILHVTNAVDAYFSVTGAYQALQGATAYEAGPFEFVEFDQNQTNINPPMSGQEEDGSQLRPFPMTGFERTVVVTGRYTNTVWDVTMTPAVWVGVVTNAVETNALGQAIVPPTADDVAYWYQKITYSEPDEQGNVQTNNDLQIYNYTLNVVDPDHPEFNTVTTNEYNQFYDYIFSDHPWLVTNECSVGTAVTKTLVPGDTWTRQETVTEWKLNETEPPLAGHDLRTRVQIDYDGFLMYRFCTTNGAYQIRRAAWQDFNSWQADENEYSRSFGLYDMKTFESDLEGRDLTIFAQSLNSVLIDTVKAMDRYSSSSGDYMYGYIGKNAKVLKDRVISDNAPDWTSKTRNTEVVLRGYPGLEGSLETTSENKGEGRGTLKMRVRSHTDDDRNIVYMGDNEAAKDWTNYRVMARIMAPNANDVSDAEHSLSLIGYWKDPNNYWEARIIQKSELMANQKGLTRNWFEVHLFQWIDGEPTEQWGEIKGRNYGGWNDYRASDTRRPTWPGRNSTDNNGEANSSAYWGYQGNENDFGLFTLSRKSGEKDVRWCFVLDLATDGTKVTPMVWAFRSHDIENGNCAGATMANALENQLSSSSYFLYKFSPIECSQSKATTKGCPGFNMRDCGLKVAPYVFGLNEAVKLDKSTAGASGYGAVPTAGQANWYHSDDALYDRNHKIDAWTVTPGTSASLAPTTVTRPAPKVFYGIRTFRTEKEEFPDGMFVAPVPFYQNGMTRDWDNDWDAYNGHDSDHDQWVAQYKWKDVSFAMNLWDQTFISIQALSENESGNTPSKGNLAVDSVTCDDWRGVTVWDKDYADTNLAVTASFGSTYAAIAADGRTGRRYELNRSRANPDRVQAITTPQLVHGVGDILFNYEVADHPVEVAVQLGDWTGSEWSDLATKVLPVGSEGSMYVPCLSNQTGRLRIVVRTPAGSAAGALGTLYVDNVRATDYPNTGDTSWEVYNALVTTFPATVAQRVTPPLSPLKLRELKFDGSTDAAATFRSAVLNDGPANQTLQGHVFDEHIPFIQTPSIETGVGEVSFWYRASPDNTGPAKLQLQVAQVGTTPDGEWTPMTVENLYWDNQTYTSPEEDKDYMQQCAALNALTNITTSTWTYFSVEFYEKDYRMLRLVGLTNDTNRVMLDNVLITEPVRSSVDVGAIEFIPDIPLSTQGTDAKVTLVNPRLHPEILGVYLDWYIDRSPTIDIPSTNEWIIVITNAHDHEVVLPGGIVAHYTTYTYETNSRPLIDVTRVPMNLKWGYESWSNRWNQGSAAGGRILLTNDQATAPYVFYTSEPIPTDRYPADTVFQYCVWVDYRGRFASPVYSELQGRVKNGFWFENPPWYDPIDLNKTFDTRERPVAHFWSFSCTTNVVFINEFQPVYGSLSALKDQFIELMGPQGASVEKWRIEHFGFDDTGELNPNYIIHTNIVTSGKPNVDATFQAPNPPGTLGKGWGFWVLGCHGIGDKANQVLFPPSWVDVDDIDEVPWYLPAPGALRLRRSMGAYVHAVTWGVERRVTDFKNLGFTYLRNYNTDDRSLAWEGSGDYMRWNITRNKTIGGYNYQAEDVLPFVNGVIEEKEEIPGIDRPEILSIDLVENNCVKIRVRVRVDAESAAKGLALKPEHYNWVFEGTSELDAWEAALPFEIAKDDAPDAPEDGTWKEHEFVLEAHTDSAPVLFFRLVATPAE